MNKESKITRRSDECLSQFLGRWIQHFYRKSIRLEKVNKVGEYHPTYTVKLVLPKGLGEFIAQGSTKQDAGNIAAEQALVELNIMY